MKIAKTVVLTALLFFSAADLYAVGRKKGDEPVCEATRPMRVTARHIESKGIGYNQGYTTVEGFFSLYNGWEDWVLFLDTRMHVFNSGRPAVNAGVGTRYLGESRTWGGNIYYDYRKTRRQHYNQVAAGFESLGEIWDFRVNGYAPVGKTNSRYYDAKFYKWEENSAIIRQRYEYALAGFNAEAGAHVRCWDHFPLYFAAGPYYLTGKGATTWGAEARASVQVYEYLSLEAYTSYDHLFKWTGQGQVGVNFSFGPKKAVRKNSKSSDSYCYTHTIAAYQPVNRFEIIPTDKQRKYSAAIDPATGKPYHFVFVDNTSASTGTYESPYHLLSDAEANSGPGDVIYIFPGDGTSTGMSSGITLQDNQRLWGSGVAQTLLTNIGAITIPAQPGGGTFNGVVVNPIISRTTMGAVITLANGNEISGLFIENTSMQTAISGTDKTNASVLNCTIAGPNVQGGTGLDLTDLAGTLTVSNCLLNQNFSMDLANTTTNLEVNISNSSFAGGDGATTSSVIWTLSDAAQGVLTATGNAFDSSFTAIQVVPGDTSSIIATVNNNAITAGGVGVYINGSGTAAETLNMDNNAITTYEQSIWLVETGTLTANITNNAMNATSSNCIEINTSTSSANGAIVATNNSINATGSDAIYFSQTGGSIVYTFTGNRIAASSGDDAFNVNIGASAVHHTFNMNGNTIAGDSGWDLSHNGGIVSSTWNNNIVNAYSYGMTVQEAVSATNQTIVLNGNTITSGSECFTADQQVGAFSATFDNNIMTSVSDGNGIQWQTLVAAVSTDVSMTGNQISAYYPVEGNHQIGDMTLSVTDNLLVGDYGLTLTLGTPGTTTMTMTDNTCSGYYGISVEHNTMTGTFNSTITDNIVAAAGAQGYVYALGSNTSINTTQTISGNTITAGPYGDAAIQLTVDTTATANFTITDNILSGGGGGLNSAVLCEMDHGTQVLDLSNNTMTNSGGYSLTAANGVQATWNVNGNEFTASGSTPVSASSFGMGTTVCMQLNDNTAYPTAGAYVLQNNTSTAGSFVLNPPQNNIGQLSTTSGTHPVVEATCP